MIRNRLLMMIIPIFLIQMLVTICHLVEIIQMSVLRLKNIQYRRISNTTTQRMV